MQESPFIELIMQRYIEQGSRENCIKNILSVLSKRFPLSDTEPVVKVLEPIQDLDRLTKLHRIAVRTSSVETFLQEVETSEE